MGKAIGKKLEISQHWVTMSKGGAFKIFKLPFLAKIVSDIICSPHLKFNNLMLISPHGLPGELGPDSLRENMLGAEHCYSEEDHARISLRSWVSVVYGKMTKIDR